MNHTVTADFDLICTCIHKHEGLIAFVKRPLATYLFCKRCGGVRNRILPIAFRRKP